MGDPEFVITPPDNEDEFELFSNYIKATAKKNRNDKLYVEKKPVYYNNSNLKEN